MVMCTTNHFEVSNVSRAIIVSGCTRFHTLVLSQRNKLWNPCLSCRRRRYTSRKSLQPSAEVRRCSARVHCSTHIQGSTLFVLAHGWKHPATSDPPSVKWKTKRCNWVDSHRKGKSNEWNHSPFTWQQHRRGFTHHHTKQCFVILNRNIPTSLF